MLVLPQPIKEYIDQSKSQNVPVDILEKQLRQQGWQDDVILQAKEYYQNGIPAAPLQTQQLPAATDLPPLNISHSPGVIAPTEVFSRKTHMGIKIGVGTLLALILLFGGSILAAYGMVPIGQGSVQQAFSNFIIGLPFMPKTKQYVIYQALQEHRKVTTFTLDASLSLSSNDISKLFGSGEFDMDIKGPVDYTDANNPSVDLHAQITNEFSADVLNKNHIVYFKISTFPAFISALLTEFGFNSSIQQQLVNKWFYQDNTPLNTEAAKNLQNQQPTQTPEETAKKFINALNTPDIQKSITMQTTTLDSFGAYHIHFAPSPAVLDEFIQQLSPPTTPSTAGTLSQSLYPAMQYKASDYINNLIIDTWIDQRQYFVREVSVSFTYKTPTSSTSDASSALQSIVPLQSQSIPVSFVLHLTDVGKPVQIDVPKNAVKFDDFFKSLVESTATQSGGLISSEFMQANNTKRRADVNVILNAIDQYAADHRGKLPVVISSITQPISSKNVNICKFIVPTYIAALPEDPTINDGTSITNCNNVYDTGYTIQMNATDERVTVAAPHAENQQAISVTR